MSADDLEEAAQAVLDLVEGEGSARWSAKMGRLLLRDQPAWIRFRQIVRAQAEDAQDRRTGSLGRALYDALAKPFNFTGVWDAPGRQDRRARYERAAKAFAAELARRAKR